MGIYIKTSGTLAFLLSKSPPSGGTDRSFHRSPNGSDQDSISKNGSKSEAACHFQLAGRPVVCWDWLKTLTALQDLQLNNLCLKRARPKPQPPHCIYNYYNQNFYPSDPLLSQCKARVREV